VKVDETVCKIRSTPKGGKTGPFVSNRPSVKMAKINVSLSWSSARMIGFFMCTATIVFFIAESSLYNTAVSSGADNLSMVTYLRNEPELSSNGDLLYCNTQPPSGSEGETFTKSDQWVLHHLLVNIRHGDRSSIHNIPSAQPLVLQTKDSTVQYLEYSALQYIPRLNSFKLTPLGDPASSSAKNSEGDLPDAFNSSSLFREADRAVAPGMLTTRGFMQHINLGHHLHRAYSKFLSSAVHSVKNLYIRSTNYRRTILSVSALMISLLPNIGGPKLEDQVPILSHPIEADEIMHGVGLRLSSHLEKGGETSFMVHVILILQSTFLYALNSTSPNFTRVVVRQRQN